jgi:hypothetical protein
MKTWVFSINDSASIAGRRPLAPGSPAASARPPTINALAATIAAKANLFEILCMRYLLGVCPPLTFHHPSDIAWSKFRTSQFLFDNSRHQFGSQ